MEALECFILSYIPPYQIDDLLVKKKKKKIPRGTSIELSRKISAPGMVYK